MKKILYVSHCLLNTATKVVMDNVAEISAEEELRRKFILEAIAKGIQLIQIPCPEFTMYGAKRWGHVSDQFDNPFFRTHCRNLLKPVMLELQEYLSHPERFEVLGFVGIDGSPSCGVKYTFCGPWGGSMSKREDWLKVIDMCRLEEKSGVFYQVLREMLDEVGIDLPFYGLYASEAERIMKLVL